ncbi:MAG TPA: hypothetical protein VEA16_02825 [Vicinamibacterales bacterium]|nr:hypothetical protein [Vicinamibacterales bacterium]
MLVLSLPLLMGCDGELDNFPTTPDPVIVTDVFSGTLTINGAQTHNVFTNATGAVTATITSLGEEAPEKVGLSMGTLSATGTCTVVLHNDNAVVSSSLNGTVSTLVGSLCVRIFDVGKLTKPVDYSITVSHP